jgi:hypothetical protein
MAVILVNFGRLGGKSEMPRLLFEDKVLAVYRCTIYHWYAEVFARP